MSFQARRELLTQVAYRYAEATRSQRRVILDEFVASTGYSRKYAIRILASPVSTNLRIVHRNRSRVYGPEVQEALVTAWMAANCICAKRLVSFLPELLGILDKHGHVVLTEEIRERLLAVSAATADRILRPIRRQGKWRSTTTTKAGRMLKHQVPIRTFADWNEGTPGFTEADLVAHCGTRAEGAFLNTLVLTDVATGWTEFLPLLYRSQDAVVDALGQMQALLPVQLLGLDTDNGSEFINAHLLEFCRAETITFTRGRPRKKNDSYFVEQKNGVIVRQFVGYDRFEGPDTYRQLTELYRAMRTYVSFFQPSMKLRSKRRDGAKVSRTYISARTPFQRTVASSKLSQVTNERLQAIYDAIDPVCLLR